jgi:hypothetical protein
MSFIFKLLQLLKQKVGFLLHKLSPVEIILSRCWPVWSFILISVLFLLNRCLPFAVSILNGLGIKSYFGLCEHCNEHFRTVRALSMSKFDVFCFNSFSYYVLYISVCVWKQLELHTMLRRCHVDEFFPSVLHSVFFFFRGETIFKFLLDISEAFVCRMSALQVKIGFLLNALQPIMLFVVALTCVRPELFP